MYPKLVLTMITLLYYRHALVEQTDSSTAECNQIKIVKMFCKFGIVVHQIALYGGTLLHLSSQLGKLPVVKFLWTGGNLHESYAGSEEE